MRKPNTAKKFKKYAIKRVSKCLQEYDKATVVTYITIDFFMALVEDHAGFGSDDAFGRGTEIEGEERTLLHPHGIYPCYAIKVCDYSKLLKKEGEGYGFHLNTRPSLSGKKDEGKETRQISAHTFDQEFDVFWKKALNLMCIIFGTELVFPEIKILESDNEWLTIK